MSGIGGSSIYSINNASNINDFVKAIGEELINIGDENEKIIVAPLLLKCGHTVDKKYLDESKKTIGEDKCLCPCCNEPAVISKNNEIVSRIINLYNDFTKKNDNSPENINKFLNSLCLILESVISERQEGEEDNLLHKISLIFDKFVIKNSLKPEGRALRAEGEEKGREVEKNAWIGEFYDAIPNFKPFNPEIYQLDKDIERLELTPGEIKIMVNGCKEERVAVDSSFSRITANRIDNKCILTLDVKDNDAGDLIKLLKSHGFKGTYQFSSDGPSTITTSDQASIGMLINILLDKRSCIRKEALEGIQNFFGKSESQEKEAKASLKIKDDFSLKGRFLNNFDKYREERYVSLGHKIIIIRSSSDKKLTITVVKYGKMLDMIMNYQTPRGGHASNLYDILKKNIKNFYCDGAAGSEAGSAILMCNAANVKVLLEVFFRQEIIDADCWKRLQSLLDE